MLFPSKISHPEDWDGKNIPVFVTVQNGTNAILTAGTVITVPSDEYKLQQHDLVILKTAQVRADHDIPPGQIGMARLISAEFHVDGTV